MTVSGGDGGVQEGMGFDDSKACSVCLWARSISAFIASTSLRIVVLEIGWIRNLVSLSRTYTRVRIETISFQNTYQHR